MSLRLIGRNSAGRRSALLIVLALGVGSGPALGLFRTVDAVLLHPLPYLQGSGVIRIWESNPTLGLPRTNVSPAAYFAWAESPALAGIAASMVLSDGMLVRLGNETRRVSASGITSNFLSVVGAHPVLGRGFVPGQEARGQTQVLISYGLWKSVFGGELNVLGKTIVEEGRATYTIAGVLPSGFALPARSDIWVQLYLHPSQAKQRTVRALHVVARLNPTVSLEQGRHAITAISAEMARHFPDTNNGWGAFVLPIDRAATLHFQATLLVLIVSGVFVLAIAIANVASLFLARALRSARTFAIELWLGARPRRILWASAIEGMVLGAAGGVLGIVLGAWTLQLLQSHAPAGIAAAQELSPRGSLQALALIACTVVGGACAVLSAGAVVSDLAVRNGLSGGPSAQRVAPHTLPRMLRALTGAAIAAAFALTLSGLLLLQSYSNLSVADRGFETKGLWVIETRLPLMVPPEAKATNVALEPELIAALRGVSGVAAASLTSAVPIDPPLDRLRAYGVVVSDKATKKPMSSAQDQPPDGGFSPIYRVGPGYFGTMHARLLEGRGIREGDSVDDSGTQGVAIINEWIAKMLWPGTSAIGKYLRLAPDAVPARRIVGVVRDRQWSADTSIGPAIYLPFFDDPSDSPLLLVRESRGDTGLTNRLVTVLRQSDLPLTIGSIRRMDDIVEEKLTRPRFTAGLTAMLAAEAIILAFFGIYGSITFMARSRLREMAVRIAVGASPREIARLLLSEAGKLGVLGAGGGLILYYFSASALTSLLYGIDALSPGAIATALVIVVVMSLLASVRAVVEASRTEAPATLRAE